MIVPVTLAGRHAIEVLGQPWTQWVIDIEAEAFDVEELRRAWLRHMQPQPFHNCSVGCLDFIIAEYRSAIEVQS